MFAERFFGDRMYAPRYFPKVGATDTTVYTLLHARPRDYTLTAPARDYALTAPERDYTLTAEER